MLYKLNLGSFVVLFFAVVVAGHITQTHPKLSYAFYKNILEILPVFLGGMGETQVNILIIFNVLNVCRISPTLLHKIFHVIRIMLYNLRKV